MKNKHLKRKYGLSFNSPAWDIRKTAIADRVKLKAREAGAKSLLRKAMVHPEKFKTTEMKNQLRIATDIVKKLIALKEKKKPFISKRSQKI